jgi:hypothetical protein
MMVELKVFDDKLVRECTKAYHSRGSFEVRKEFLHLLRPVSQMPGFDHKGAHQIMKEIEEQFGETIFATRAGYPYWRSFN